MVISLDEVRLLIEASLPGAEVEVLDETGTQDHLRAEVTAPQFNGLSQLEIARRMAFALERGKRQVEGTAE